MRLIISQSGVKREITGAFALCCSADDLDHLSQLLKSARASLTANGGNYGWVRIDPNHPDDGPSNTKPLLWTE
jgi:hypothetical protein